MQCSHCGKDPMLPSDIEADTRCISCGDLICQRCGRVRIDRFHHGFDRTQRPAARERT